ncbi:hypothetical protein ABRY23_09870 [Melioribacteraceae bacterium 4301-Me]|uniref:hypothetical protein n=1 Tax=Pyranulibacter aquaticus TaxID=3163344 RepID=UPI00359B7C79
MKKVLKKFLIFFLCAGFTAAQVNYAKKVLQQVIKTFNKIQDYQADMEIIVDMEFIKMPTTKAKIYFKQPNKVKFESKGFTILPKQSLIFSPLDLLTGDFTPIYLRKEKLNNYNVDVIKVIPNNDSSDIVVTTLWVDKTKHIIRRVESIGKRTGPIFIDLNYDNNLILPSTVKFAFQDSGSDSLTEKRQNNSPQIRSLPKLSGHITINYSNYKINQGLSDSFFIEKNK